MRIRFPVPVARRTLGDEIIWVYPRLVERRIWPRPSHCGHVSSSVPSFAPCPGTRRRRRSSGTASSGSAPVTAVGKGSGSRPRRRSRGTTGFPRRVPPDGERSADEPLPQQLLEEASSRRGGPRGRPACVKFCQVNPPGPKSLSTPPNPIWSYRRRFSGSTRTSYASLTSLNFSSAALASPRVDVGVVQAGELPVRRLHLVGRRGAGDPEHLVVVALRHDAYPRGRRSATCGVAIYAFGPMARRWSRAGPTAGRAVTRSRATRVA